MESWARMLAKWFNTEQTNQSMWTIHWSAMPVKTLIKNMKHFNNLKTQNYLILSSCSSFSARMYLLLINTVLVHWMDQVLATRLMGHLVMVNECIARLSLMPRKQVNALGFTWIHVQSMWLAFQGAGEIPHACVKAVSNNSACRAWVQIRGEIV